MQLETGDVLAAAEYLKNEPEVDMSRLAIMGWSFGGIVTIFASSRSTIFRAAVDQAGGGLTWPYSLALQDAMKKAAEVGNTPVFLLAARNDRTTEPLNVLAKIFEAHNRPYEVKIYPPFTPPPGTLGLGTVAPGHLIFSRAGLPIWGDDVLRFLTRYMK
jgi:dienelactone hydrolase